MLYTRHGDWFVRVINFIGLHCQIVLFSLWRQGQTDNVSRSHGKNAHGTFPVLVSVIIYIQDDQNFVLQI